MGTNFTSSSAATLTPCITDENRNLRPHFVSLIVTVKLAGGLLTVKSAGGLLTVKSVGGLLTLFHQHQSVLFPVDLPYQDVVNTGINVS